MLKDIQDSARVNTVIRRNQRLEPSDEEINIAHANFDIHDGGDMVPEGMLKPSLHAKILSRLFWPQLHDESYRVPDEIGRLQKLYETGFESLKASRKLTWLHALGQATVELELTDRTMTEEVHTWQATIIRAFQSDEPGDATVRRSVDELVQHLDMDEALVRGALKFWVNKLVLQEVQKDVFSVLETLNQEDRARSNAQAAANAAAAPDDSMGDAALMTNEGITAEKEQMYWQFIQGMLKNSSSQMPLQQIAMMLKMLIVDGFPYSNEELQVFLGSKITDGELEFVGGKYRLKK
jgi:anaphase-promoting complex subunit 2